MKVLDAMALSRKKRYLYGPEKRGPGMDEQYKDPEFLEEQYVELGKSQRKIGKMCDVSHMTIGNWLNEYKIERKDGKYKDPEFLEVQYVELGKSRKEIANMCGVGTTTIGEWLQKCGIGDRAECEQCGELYECIGNHWGHPFTSCEYPSFTDRQKEIITGFLMSDASINRSEKNPRIKSNMITPEFLEWVDEEMGIFGTGVNFKMSAEESACRSRERGFSPNAKSENYHDIYQWSSICHPELQEFAAWYDTGKKVWPDSVRFTPLSLKVFYCGDGCFHTSNKTGYVVFSLSNERENKEKIEKLFYNVGITSGRWEEGESFCNYALNVEQSQKCFDIMGDPLPGFEYKWPEHLR